MKDFLIGTATGNFKTLYGDYKQFEKIKECGFDSVDLGLHSYQNDPDFFLLKSEAEIKNFALSLKNCANDNGLIIGQTHAPFNFPPERFDDRDLVDMEINAIKATSFMGSKYIIMHSALSADPFTHTQEDWEINIRFYKKMIPALRDYGVKIAIENLFTWNPIKKQYYANNVSSASQINKMIEELGSDCFCACVDAGHALLGGQDPSGMVRALKENVGVLHLQDNNGVDDLHLLPGLGYIDWENFLSALKEIGYKGVLNFEIEFFRVGQNEKAVEKYAACAAEVGRSFAKKLLQ